MPWIEFTAPFEWKPKQNVMICYRADKSYLVTSRCAAAAIEQGKGRACARPTNIHKGDHERGRTAASDRV